MKINDLDQFKCEEIEIKFHNMPIKVKQYISEANKLYIADIVKKVYFSDNIAESGLSNKTLKHPIFIVSIVRFYTDIDTSEEEYLSICDSVVQSGLFDVLLSTIPESEINILYQMVEEAIQEENARLAQLDIETKHQELMLKLEEVKAESLEVQLGRFLQMAIDKIPTDKKLLSFIKLAKKEFNGFKLDKYPELKKLLESLGEKSIPSVEDLNATIDKVTEFASKNIKKENLS